MSDEHLQGTGSAEIGRRLRELRLARGLLQQDLATAEISTSYVSLIEAGKRRPSPAILAALAERVGSSVEYLCTGRDQADVKNLQLELGFAEMALRNGSPGEALQSFSHVLTKTSALSPDMLLRARIGQATALEKLGRLEAAVSLLHELADDPGLAAGSAQWAQVTVALCRCYRIVGDINMSVEIGERAVRRLDGLGLDVTDDHIMLGVDLVGSYYRRADFTRAHLLSSRLLAQAEQSQSRSARGMVYWNASLIAESRGQREEAIALVERALGFMAEGDSPRYLALLKAVHAMMLFRSGTGDLEQSRALLDQAKATLDEVGSVHERGDCEVNLAQVTMRLGRSEEALELAARAVDILSGENPGNLAAEALVTLGEAQLLNDRAAEGQASLQAAARQLRQLPRSRGVTAVYRYLGDVWDRHGNTGEAMRAYQEGLTAGGADALPAPPQHRAVARTT